MPFTAYIAGEKVNALDYSQEDWEALKKARPEVTFPRSGERGSMVTSRRGTPFFRHRPGSSCSGEGESEEHIECKRIIYLTAKAFGFDAEMEAPIGDRSADVLVQTHAGKLAFEVQKSGQTAEETIKRSECYLANDVRPVWFAKASLVEDLSAYVPIFKIDMADIADIKVRMPETGFVALEEGVRQILMGEIPLKVDIDAYVPPWQPAEDTGVIELPDSVWRFLGYLALGGIGLALWAYLVSPRKPRR